ncbi:MAG: NAD(P)H-dependent oxidoreductase, partial [Bacteroidota bacterium]
MEKKILILFAHPRFEQSKANRALLEGIKGMKNVTLHDLYDQYHDFNIDVVMEKSLLEHHDVVIWHHPFYWYSCPPLLKQWIDMVLEFGWAYGPHGTALEGKQALNVITAGGTKEVYCQEGRNNYTVKEF